jgi:hypothetical protein
MIGAIKRGSDSVAPPFPAIARPVELGHLQAEPSAEVDGVVAGGLEGDADLAEPEQCLLAVGIDVGDFREVHDDAIRRQPLNQPDSVKLKRIEDRDG